MIPYDVRMDCSHNCPPKLEVLTDSHYNEQPQ